MIYHKKLTRVWTYFDSLNFNNGKKNNHYGILHVKWLLKYAGPQKVFEGGVDTWRHLHVTLRWLKIRTVQFFFNLSSKYSSRVKTLRWLTFFSSKTLRWLKIRTVFSSNPFSLRDGYFELKLKKNWTVRSPAISRTPAYIQKDGLRAKK